MGLRQIALAAALAAAAVGCGAPGAGPFAGRYEGALTGPGGSVAAVVIAAPGEPGTDVSFILASDGFGCTVHAHRTDARASVVAGATCELTTAEGARTLRVASGAASIEGSRLTMDVTFTELGGAQPGRTFPARFEGDRR